MPAEVVSLLGCGQGGSFQQHGQNLGPVQWLQISCVCFPLTCPGDFEGVSDGGGLSPR